MATSIAAITESSSTLQTQFEGILADLKVKVEAAQALVLKDDASNAEITRAIDEIKVGVDDFNDIHKQYVYAVLYESDNPMLNACKYGEVDELRFLDTTDKESGIRVLSLATRKSRNAIDLVEFDARAPKGHYAVNGQWSVWAGQLAKRIAHAYCTGSGVAVPKGKTLSELLNGAYSVDVAAGAYPDACKEGISNAKLTKDLQAIVDAILFEDNGDGKNKYKVTTHDCVFLDYRKGKAGNSALSTRIIGRKEMCMAIGSIMYHLTTNKPYGMDKLIKESK